MWSDLVLEERVNERLSTQIQHLSNIEQEATEAIVEEVGQTEELANVADA